MDSMEVDSVLGGMLSKAIAGGVVDRGELRGLLRTLLDHPEWHDVIFERYGLLIEVATALVEL